MTRDFMEFIHQILMRRAVETPDAHACGFLSHQELDVTWLTYSRLDQCARSIAAGLEEHLAVGDRVLLPHSHGAEFVTAFFGCLYANVIPVPTTPPAANRNNQRVESVFADARPQLILTTSGLKSRFADYARTVLLIEEFVEKEVSGWLPAITPQDAIAFLQYTSGSTSSPRGVMVSHRNLIANETMIRESFQHDPSCLCLGWLPMFHDMGLIGNLLQPIYVGFPTILMPPLSFIQRPIRWLEAMSRFRATTSGAPNFAYDHCLRRINEEERKSLDLSAWKVAFNGSEPIRYQTIQAFLDFFRPAGLRPDVFLNCYGMAEATLLISGRPKPCLPQVKHVDRNDLQERRITTVEPGEGSAQAIVGCGKATLGEQLLIVEPDTQEVCDESGVGEIWVSGEHVAAGYWNRESDLVFGAYLNSGEGPFLRTGDLGFLDDDGSCSLWGV